VGIGLRSSGKLSCPLRRAARARGSMIERLSVRWEELEAEHEKADVSTKSLFRLCDGLESVVRFRKSSGFGIRPLLEDQPIARAARCVYGDRL
jgi:hypothetical protein